MPQADDSVRKRRRLDNKLCPQTSTQTQSYISLVCKDDASIYWHNNNEYHSSNNGLEGYTSEPCMLVRPHDVVEEELIDGDNVPSQECCYGMLPNIPINPKTASNFETENIPALFQNPNTVIAQTDHGPLIFEAICPIYCKLIKELKSIAEITAQLYCNSRLDFSSTLKSNPASRRRIKPSQIWLLNVIIYGPSELEDTVGDYLTKHKKYLQDPSGCDRNVVYRNPHIISTETEEAVMTEAFYLPDNHLEIERLQIGPDLLAQLMENETPLPETEAPPIITTPLFPHQKQALTFMLRREEGWALDETRRDVWSKKADNGRSCFVNNVSGSCHYEPPEGFQGGLLADDMGLGKTLSMISLIAANQTPKDLPTLPITPEPFGRTVHPVVKTTLLIVPAPLLQAWEKQFQMHVRPGALKCYTFHGPNREGVASLGRYDVVITTYQIVSNMRRNRAIGAEDLDSISSILWHRVIIDEAHIIQTQQSQLAQACCAIRSPRRWAITGTPIQNKLTDFASIVKFLRVYPYSESGKFDEDITKSWHRGEKESFYRLKTLVRAITISRTKAVVDLPPRTDEIHHLDFTAVERAKYEIATKYTRILIEDAISSGVQGGKIFNALQRLNILRLICCHGLLAKVGDERTATPTSRARQETWMQDPENAFYKNILRGSVSCSQCGTDLLEEFLEGSPSARLQNEGKFRTLCNQCCPQSSIMGQSPVPFDQMDISDSSACASPAMVMNDEENSQPVQSMSTKIKALVADLLKHSVSEKSAVFSFWTYTLDLIQLMLDDCGIPYTRIDGKTPLKKRTEALKQFRRDDSCRVILVSITCGGAGLDLTAASRVYLLEPHWNPMIEEQALCRVHRVGQTRSVTTVRYLIRDSFEEQVVKLQKRKRDLAEATFGHNLLSEDGIGLGTLEYLKSVLG